MAARVRPRAPARALPRQGARLQRLPAQGRLHRLRPRARDRPPARPVAALRGRPLPPRHRADDGRARRCCSFVVEVARHHRRAGAGAAGRPARRRRARGALAGARPAASTRPTSPTRVPRTACGWSSRAPTGARRPVATPSRRAQPRSPRDADPRVDALDAAAQVLRTIPAQVAICRSAPRVDQRLEPPSGGDVDLRGSCAELRARLGASDPAWAALAAAICELRRQRRAGRRRPSAPRPPSPWESAGKLAGWTRRSRSQPARRDAATTSRPGTPLGRAGGGGRLDDEQRGEADQHQRDARGGTGRPRSAATGRAARTISRPRSELVQSALTGHALQTWAWRGSARAGARGRTRAATAAGLPGRPSGRGRGRRRNPRCGSGSARRWVWRAAAPARTRRHEQSPA